MKKLLGVVALMVFEMACGGPPPPEEPGKITGALVADPNDHTHAGRAAYYQARATAMRELAAKKRQLSAVLGGKPARSAPTTTSDLSVTQKADLDARATALDTAATSLQALADYNAAEAAKEVK
jgi:hypothetical protein